MRRHKMKELVVHNNENIIPAYIEFIKIYKSGIAGMENGCQELNSPKH